MLDLWEELVELDRIGIDFTQFVEMAGVSDGMKEEVLLTMSDFSHNFRQSSDSTNGVLEIDCTALCKVKVTDEVTREVLQDAYSPHTMIKFDQRQLFARLRAVHYSETIP